MSSSSSLLLDDVKTTRNEIYELVTNPFLFHAVEFPEDEPVFKELMQEYLFSPEGRHHLQDVKFEGSILDLEGNFNITVSAFMF